MTTAFDHALAGFRLGQSDTTLRLEGAEQFARATQALVQQTRRDLFLLTPDLEPERYNTEAFGAALSALARRSRHSDVRILLGDPAIAVRWGHKVVALSRRLPSRLRIRQLHEDDFDPEEAFIVCDDIALLRRDGMAGYAGSLVARAIPHAQRAAARFLERWERAHEVPDFRELGI